MRRVVKGQPDGHDEDHARDDLDGEAAEVRVAGDVGDGELGDGGELGDEIELARIAHSV